MLKITLVEYNYHRKGNNYYEQGNYSSAIAEYTKAIAIDPSYASVYVDRGKAQIEKQNFIPALKDLEMALFIHENHVSENNSHDRYRMYQDIYSVEELNNIKRFIERHIIDEEIAIVPTMLSTQGRKRSVMSKYEQAKAYAYRGYVSGFLGYFEEAITDYEIALQTNLEFVQVYLFMGQTYEMLGQTEIAKEAYEAFIAKTSPPYKIRWTDKDRELAIQRIAILDKANE